MIENTKVRWAIVLSVLLVALIWVLPNFVKVGENWVFSQSTINYGLDIQGGLHLVMGVDVDEVIAEKTSRMALNLPNELKDQALNFKSVKLDQENKRDIRVEVSSQSEAEGIEKFIGDYYPGTLQVLEASPSMVELRFFDAKIREYKSQTVSQAIEVIRNRIDEFGVSEPNIAAQGDNRIIVQLPGIDNANRAKDLINRTAKLAFTPVSKKADISQVSTWITEAETAGNYALGKDSMGYAAYVKRLNEDLKGKLPENTKIVFEKAEGAANLEAGKIPYVVETGDEITGDQLEDASVRPDQYGKPQVAFRLNFDGGRRFGEMSQANIGNPVAIVLDDVVKSAPTIQSRIDKEGVITLNQQNYQQTLEEAQFIATTLRAGALPAALEQLEERTVGPTLGKDSIEKGKLAGLVGGLLVLVFMLIYYRKLGVVANLALGFNVLLILAILTSLGATLTLPGVAGIVLTVGMAVDANVIIFERIKEELRKGTGVRLAVKDGFGHALSAIVDANITTAAVCFVLMYFGTGPVRGFAVTLICGIVTSMFTSIFVARTLIDFMINKMNVKTLARV